MNDDYLNKYSQKLYYTNAIFLQSVLPFIEAEIIVGSLSWGRREYVHEGSDLDAVVVYQERHLDSLLNTEYLQGHFTKGAVQQVLKNAYADYFVAKLDIAGVKFSIDFISESFFSRVCQIDLNAERQDRCSHKYGQFSQTNTYTVRSFTGIEKVVTKISAPYSDGGFFIELPLFHIFHDNENSIGEYFYGIPTVKLLTPTVVYDIDNNVKRNLDCLKKLVISRMEYEFSYFKDRRNNNRYNLLNLFIFKSKMDRDIIQKYDITPYRCEEQ